MAIDARNLKPAAAVRVINSTPQGEVTSDKKMKSHRGRGGVRVASNKDLANVDLVKYGGWTDEEKVEDVVVPPAPGQATLDDGYEAMKERARARSALLSTSGRDIGKIPPVDDQARRDKAEKDFRYFCETYFPQTFPLAWSDDHLKVIAKIERAVIRGDLFAMAMPRGSGKTTLCEIASIWAIVYGHRSFVAVIGADEPHAEGMLDSIKAEFERNDLLAADFPEVCHPIRSLEGIHQRAAGQLYLGRQTYIEWASKDVVLPTIPGSMASGAVIQVAGITGRIRGMKHKRADGTSIRPDLVLVDDPQTDESAKSPSQCAYREGILNGAILGLAGPGKKIAGLMTLTVVTAGDMADRMLDPTKYPQWQGERTKMVYAFPTDEKLWTEYSRLRRDGFATGAGARPCNAFYRKHRKAMDRGAKIAWPARKNPDDLSPLQTAMNLRIDLGDDAFFAEYQNEPKVAAADADRAALKADAIAGRLNRHKRGLVPATCSKLTMFIDVQGKCLWYTVVGWEDDFTGYVVDYGCEPDQRSAYFTLREVKHTLELAAPGSTLEGAIYAGLERLVDTTVGREWIADNGASMRIERCLIDANWGDSTEVVKLYCRQSRHAGIVMPSHGRGVGASSVPFTDYRKNRGDRIGMNWKVPATIGRSGVRHLLWDVNWWKSFVRKRLTAAIGDPGAMTLFGDKADAHRLFCDHMTSEYSIQTSGRGRTVDEWRIRVEGRDNHWWDCLVGCAAAASMLSCALPGLGSAIPPPRQRVSFSELQRQAQARR